ncbi:MAG: DUF4381 family protein [Akkermansiaceae bacterium]
MPPLKDITDPSPFLPPPTPIWHEWWFWVSIAAGIITLAVILYFIFKPKAAAASRRSLLDDARTRLKTLRENAEQTPPQTLATRISIIIRRYLEAAFKDPALFETNEEFTLRKTALQNIHPDLKTSITDFLHDLSQLKYAPADHPNPAQLIDDAEALLSTIERQP